MKDEIERVEDKVKAVMLEHFGEKACVFGAAHVNKVAMKKYTDALTPVYGDENAAELALHLCDWGWDAAFIIAMHICPDRFLEDEIEAGVGMFMGHVPNHLAAACRICGVDMLDIFGGDPDN